MRKRDLHVAYEFYSVSFLGNRNDSWHRVEDFGGNLTGKKPKTFGRYMGYLHHFLHGNQMEAENPHRIVS